MMSNSQQERLDPNLMDIDIYVDQFGTYCEPHDVKPDRKVALFLSSVGHNLFSTLKDLFVRDKLQKQSFDKIEEVLKEHFVSKGNIIIEIYKFRMMRQSQVQSAAEFLRQLGKRATKCDYGDSLNDILRDQLVVGVFREDIRRRLLADHNLTLEKAINTITVDEQV